MTTATLDNNRATDASATLHSWGVWHADATLDAEVTLSGFVDLKIADLTLKGTIISGGAEKGRSKYRLVGGKGGWGKLLREKSYGPNDLGVKLSTVLADAAREAGETLDASTVPDRRLGPNYVRPAGRASLVLEQTSPGAWYVGEDGVTRIGARPASTLPEKVTHGPVDRSRGSVTLASETIATILPGVSVDGFVAVDVVHSCSPKGGLRSTIYGRVPGHAASDLEALRDLLEYLDPGRRFRGFTEYRIVDQDGERLSLQPVLKSTGMPDVERVFVRPSMPGARSDYALGSYVLVSFVNGDPGRPFVAFAADAEGEGFRPLKTEIDADAIVLAAGALGVARVGDTVTCPAGTGTITTGSSKVKCG